MVSMPDAGMFSTLNDAERQRSTPRRPFAKMYGCNVLTQSNNTTWIECAWLERREAPIWRGNRRRRLAFREIRRKVEVVAAIQLLSPLRGLWICCGQSLGLTPQAIAFRPSGASGSQQTQPVYHLPPWTTPPQPLTPFRSTARRRWMPRRNCRATRWPPAWWCC